MWSTGEGKWQNTSLFLPWEPHKHYEKEKDRTLKDTHPIFRLVGAQYATGEEWKNNSRKNEGMEPKQKQYPVVDVTGDGSKVWCCKEQYCIGTWNVRSVNQGKLDVIKQEMARMNIDILGITKISTSASLTTSKPLNVWITTNYGKFLKRREEYQTTSPAPWETYMQAKD